MSEKNSSTSIFSSNVTPITAKIYNFFPPTVVTEDVPAVGDSDFHQILNIKLGVETCLSLQCIVMNSLLLGFLFYNKEFRSWSFFPLMMQAAVDILGPGFGNLIFELKLFNKWPEVGVAILKYYNRWRIYAKSVHFSKPYIFNPYDLQTIYGIDGCIILHLRSLLNEYSTGYCLLLTAVYRYLLICHPTVKLSRKIKIWLSIGLIMIPIVSITFSAAELIWGETETKTTDFHLLDLSVVGGSAADRPFQLPNNIWSKLLYKCFGLSTRKWYRVIVESLVFFVIPVLLIAFLYGSVILRLTQRGRKHAGRNRVLTLAFVLSWICWIACWAPNLVTLTLDNFTLSSNKLSRNGLTFRDQSKLETYWMAFTIPVQLLYSHLNPFVYLLVLKKFQQYHVMVFTKIWHFFFSKRVQTGIQESIEVPKRKASVVASVAKCFVAILLVCLTSLVSLYFGVTFSNKRMLSSHVESTLKNFARNSAYLENHRRKSVLNYFDPLTRDPSFDIRKVCAEYKGLTSLKYQRCFVLVDKRPQLLSFDEQVQYCKGYKANLCYPRSKEEMIFMWEVYENWLIGEQYFLLEQYREFLYDKYINEDQEILEWMLEYSYWSWKNSLESQNWLQMGLVRHTNSMFVSVDSKFNISSETESWFYSWDKVADSNFSLDNDYEDNFFNVYNVRDFHGPGACLTSLPTTLFECRITRKNSELMCCKDFLN